VQSGEGLGRQMTVPISPLISHDELNHPQF